MGDDDAQPLRLLALDGGGIRGLSELIILKRLMQKVDRNKPPKPCEYFHLMGGTSTGGLIAIMLGRLKLDIDECIDRYMQLSSSAFQPKRPRHDLFGRGKDLWKAEGKYNSESLVDEIKEVTKLVTGDENARLLDPAGSCKVFVCAHSKAPNAAVKIRSYSTNNAVQNLSTAECTIWEAARATSAASGFFDPIRIGFQDFVDGATGMNNPVELVLEETNSIWPAATQRIQCLVSIGTGIPDLKNFGDNLWQLKDTLIALATETETTEERFYQQHTQLGLAGRYFRFNVDRGLRAVRLDEHERKGEIVAITECYLENPRIKELADKFVQARPQQDILASEAAKYRYLTWLPYTDSRRQHNEARRHRSHIRTGEWFLDGEFQRWKQIPRSFLWLHAKAGAGKTVLVSTIIDKLEVESLGPVIFFYFSFQDDARTLDLWHFKCSLLAQVLQSLIIEDSSQAGWYRIPKAFHKLYHEYQPSSNPPMEAVDKTLRALLGQSGNLHFVVDGLDECPAPHRQVITEFLASLLEYPQSGCHVVVTSRREPDIEKTVNGLSIEKSVLPFNNHEVNRDIRQHLLGVVKKEPYRRWSDQLKDKVINHLTGHSDGVFRWADLQIEALADKEREKDVEKALKRLPSDLAKTYQRMLLRIENDDYGEEAVAVLRWLAHAVEPLTLSQVAELAGFETVTNGCLPNSDGYSVKFNTRARFSGTLAIRAILSGLVTFTGSQGPDLEADGGQILVSFSHFSVKEYLESSDVSPRFFQLERNCCQWFILKSCVAYMQQYDADDAAACKAAPYPLLRYACGYLVRHAHELSKDLTSSEERNQLRRICSQLFYAKSTKEGKSVAMAMRVAVLWAGKNANDEISQSVLGIGSFSNRDLDPIASDFTDPWLLHSAAALGDASSVQLALDSDVRVSGKYGYGPDATTALHSAARKQWITTGCVSELSTDYSSVIRQLIDAGCNINAADSDGCTPLGTAAAAGHNDVVRHLLGYPDVELTSRNNDKQTPLFVAVAGGRADVVDTFRQLRDPGLNIPDRYGQTPLMAAAANGRDAIVKTLLADERVTPDATDERGRTAIFWAAERGHEKCFLVLLYHPLTDISLEDGEGQNVLTVAADKGHSHILSIILDRTDLDINSRDCYGRTALSWAASRGGAAVVEKLLEQRRLTIDVNSKDYLGRTALLWAAFHGHEQVVGLLLAHDSVDSGSGDVYGITPLQWATCRSHSSVASRLQGHHGTAGGDGSAPPSAGLPPSAPTDPNQPTGPLGTTETEFRLFHELRADDEIWDVKFSNDGRFLSSCGAGRAVIIWHVRSWKAAQILRAGKFGVASLSWSRDDSMLITCGRDGYADLWDTSSGVCIRRIGPFQEPITQSVWAPHGSWFIFGTFEKNRTLCQWDAGLTGEPIFWPGVDFRVECLAIAPNGDRIVAMDDLATLHICNPATKEREYQHKTSFRPTSVCISQDSNHLLHLQQNGDLTLMDLATAGTVQTYIGATVGNYLIQCAFGGLNDRFVLSASEDGNIIVWDKDSAHCLARLEGHAPRSNTVAWHPTDAHMFASGGDDHAIKIWSRT